MPNSRAMIAPCDSMPPRSMTSPEMSGNTGPQPGSVCRVTSTSPGTQPVASPTSAQHGRRAVTMPPQAPTPVQIAVDGLAPRPTSDACRAEIRRPPRRRSCRGDDRAQLGVRAGARTPTSARDAVRKHRAARRAARRLPSAVRKNTSSATREPPTAHQPSPIARTMRRQRV